jgi:hypothetical protein
VLFLFVIMLLNLGHDYQSDLRMDCGSGRFGSAGLIGFALWRAFQSSGAVLSRAAASESMRGGFLNAVGAIASRSSVTSWYRSS